MRGFQSILRRAALSVSGSLALGAGIAAIPTAGLALAAAPAAAATLPPVADFHAEQRSDTALFLQWDVLSSEYDAYRQFDLYRDGAKIQTVPGYAGQTLVTGLTPGTSYEFTLIKRDVDPWSADDHPTAPATITVQTLIAGQDEIKPTSAATRFVWIGGSLQASWFPATDDHGVVGYDVVVNGEPVERTTKTWATLDDLGLTPDDSLAIVAVDAAGNRAPAGPPIPLSSFQADHAVTKTYTFQCSFPGLGSLPARALLDVGYLASPQNTNSRQGAGLHLIVDLNGAKTALQAAGYTAVAGSAKAPVTLSGDSGSRAFAATASTIERLLDDSEGLYLAGNEAGWFTQLPQDGLATMTFGGLSLSLTARRAGTTETLDVPCILDPVGQNTTIGSTTLVSDPPGPPVPTPSTPLPPRTTPGEQRTLTYQCRYPFLGDAKVQVTYDADLSRPAAAGTNGDLLRVDAKVTASPRVEELLRVFGAARTYGSANLDVTVTGPGDVETIATAPLGLEVRDTAPAGGGSVQNASGNIPPVGFPEGGTATYAATSLTLTITGVRADGTAAFLGFGVDPPSTLTVPCRLDPDVQNTVLGTRTVLPSGTTPTSPATTPGVPPKTTPVPVTPPPTTPVPPILTTPKTTNGTSPPPPRTTPAPTTPTATTPVTTPDPTPVNYAYTLAGAATLKTLVKGTLPIKGGLRAHLDTRSGAFTADLSLQPTSGKLKALGFLPVTADVVLVPTAPATGTLTGGKLAATAKVRIKLPKVTLFGLTIAGGTGCQTKQASALTLRSTQPTFQPLSGGPISGTFAISDLTGCGSLTGLVSPLTKGTGNVISLDLTPSA